jgi:hypothetical protein
MSIVWFQRPKPRPRHLLHEESQKRALVYSMRVIPLIKPGDLILLPEDDRVREFFDFCSKTLGFCNTSAIWTYEEDAYDDDALMLAWDRTSISVGCGYAMYPYAMTRSCEFIAQKLGLTIKADSREWTEIFSNKKVLLTLKEHGVSIPESYYCETTEELLHAYRLLKQEGRDVLLKPCGTAAGAGICEILSETALTEYTFAFGGVLLQEKMHVDRYEDGSPIIPSVQFCPAGIRGVVDQLVDGFMFVGSCYPSRVSSQLMDEIVSVTEKIVAIIKPQGPGGLDFVCVNNKPYLIDPNLGRLTAVHPIWHFRERYAPGKQFSSCSISLPLSIYDFWEKLKKVGIAFDFKFSRKGVFPLYWFAHGSSKLMVFGNTYDEIQVMLEKLRSIEICL